MDLQAQTSLNNVLQEKVQLDSRVTVLEVQLASQLNTNKKLKSLKSETKRMIESIRCLEEENSALKANPQSDSTLQTILYKLSTEFKNTSKEILSLEEHMKKPKAGIT